MKRQGRRSGATTPEARFLGMCVREPEVVDRNALAAATRMVHDWSSVVTTAARHGIAALVWETATREELPVPLEVLDDLQWVGSTMLDRGLELDAVLRRALAALADAGVPVVVLKGPALARTIYPDVAYRPYTDIDIVVDVGREAAATNALVGCGLAVLGVDAEGRHEPYEAHEHDGAVIYRAFGDPPSGAKLELHLEPLHLGLRPTCEAERWERAVPVPGLAGALMLAPEDQVVQLSAHVHRHGFNRLLWLKDIDLLTRVNADRLDWSLVKRVAAREGVLGSVWYTLELAVELLASPIPAAVIASFRPARLTRALYGLVWPRPVIAGLDAPMRRRAVQFDATASWRGVLPSMLLMGRRRDRVRALLHYVR